MRNQRKSNYSQQLIRSHMNNHKKVKSGKLLQKWSLSIDKINEEEIPLTTSTIQMKKRKSLFDDLKASTYSSKDMNFSCIKNIKNKKCKQDFGRFRMLIDKSKTLSKQEKSLIGSNRQQSNIFEVENSYKTIHTNFMDSLKRNHDRKKQQDEKKERQSIFVSTAPQKTFNLPTKDPIYFKNRVEQLKRKKQLEPFSLFSLNESSYINKSYIQGDNQNQFQEVFEQIARKQQYIEPHNPGTIIYNHFSNKYRDYHTIKAVQVQDDLNKNKFLKKEQKRILSNLKKKGISQQNQFRIVSRFNQTHLLMAGCVIKKHSCSTLKSEIDTLKKANKKK